MKRIIGGVITLIIGVSIFAISESDIAKNFSDNTGMTQEQAEEYINDISEDELDSFSEIGQDFIDEGNLLVDGLGDIDCINYTYEWETSLLSCLDGKDQLQTMGNDVIRLGNCYKLLDTDLGDSAESKMSECISDIDRVNSNYTLPIATAILDTEDITDLVNTNIYNKSLLEAALESE